MNKSKNWSTSFMVMLLTILGCQTQTKHGPLIATIENGSVKFEVPKEKIQASLQTLLLPTETDFKIETMDIVEQNNHTFLHITGVNNEKCMVALEKINIKLYELNDNKIPIVVCYGCKEGCDPQWKSEGWICSGSCSDCTKSVSISDEYIFE